MHPVLFTIPEFQLFGHRFNHFDVRSYGVMLVIGILAAVWWSSRRAARWGISSERIYDATLWGIVPGVLGARIGYIVQEWGYYSAHPADIWSWQFAGLTSFGGVVMAVAGLVAYCKFAKVPALAFLDVVSAPLLVAHAVGRVGCLLNGCCYGHPTTEWFGVRVEGVAGLFEPAQMVDAFLVMVGVGVLMLFERKRRSSGLSFGLTLVLWGAARFIYEFFRAGTNLEVARGLASSTYWGSLPVTQAQVAALVLVLVGAAMMWLCARNRAAQAVEAPK